MDRKQLDDIMDAVDHHLAPAGFECIEAEWIPKEGLLRLYIDRPTGVDMVACVEATRLLQDWPGIEGRPAGSYTLEVSSPGIERPLRRRQHFERFINSDMMIRLKSKEGQEGDRRKGSGRLEAISAEGQFKICLDEGGEWTFPFASIHKAHLVHKWDS